MHVFQHVKRVLYCILFTDPPVYLLNVSILAAHVHPHVGEGAASRQEVGGDGDVVRDPHADVLIRGLRELIAILGWVSPNQSTPKSWDFGWIGFWAACLLPWGADRS